MGDIEETQIGAPESDAATTLPDGEYAIVEVMGHRTIVGRVTEVERFGTKLMQIEPLFQSQLLAGVLIGGGSIYQFTPCSKEVAAERQPKQEYQLPPAVAATLPPALLPSPDERPAFVHTTVYDRDLDDDVDNDGLPF
jgi:hypothetical protein